MKKMQLSLLTILLFSACQKRISTEKAAHEINSVAAKVPKIKIRGCQNQVWMEQNLNVSTYRNGDPIPQVTDPTAWSALTTGAWCYYNNDPSTGAIYGKLYNWYAINDPRGLAPEGWHIPTDEEWTALSTCLGGATVAGGKMKSTGTIEDGTGLWYAPNTATNSSGFTGLPGGSRFVFGSFSEIGYTGSWWSTKEFNGGASIRYLYNNSEAFSDGNTYHSFSWGHSVRCIKD